MFQQKKSSKRATATAKMGCESVGQETKVEIIDIEIMESEGRENDTVHAITSSLLKKDQLPEANCCRFCGLGGRNELSTQTPEVLDSDFISIYQKPFEDAAESLDFSINRYLPIKVCEDDLYYPKVICLPCYDSFEKTVWFFDKISEGQALLSKIINQIEDVKNKAVKMEKKLQLEFSEENPILNAKKRRGRPRKDASKPKMPTPTPVVAYEYLERTRRKSRPPARFVAFDLSTNEEDDPLQQKINLEHKRDEFSIFLNTEKGNADNSAAEKEINEPQTKSVDRIQKPTDSNLITSIENDFSNLSGLTRRENLMDLVKLNVIMDGDEEVESTVLQIVDSDQSQAKTTIRKIPIANKTLATGNISELQEQKDYVTKSNAASPDEELAQEDIEDLEDMELEGSDTSVKLSDLIGRAKKSLRKKRKRRRKSYRGRQLNCTDCDRIFSHQSSLLYHRVAVHDQVKKFVCPTCKKGFTHKQLLTNHLYIHYEERFFACEICTSKFKSRASLYTHKKSVHTTKRDFTCEKCGFQFNLKSSLKAHMRLHTGEKPFTCEFCQKRFAQRSNMVEHRRIHTGERPYICPTTDCDKSFTTASQLRNHKLTHSGLKPFLCSVCGKGFANNENFKYHMRRHAGDRPLECPVCHKQFIEPWSLKKHWRLHTGEKPYECTQCNKVFSDPSNYSKHKKMHIMDNSEPIQDEALYENSDTQSNSKTNATVSEIQEDEDDDNGEIAELNSQMVSDAGQTENDECELVENETQSLVHILNAENLTTLEGGDHDGQSSVIYVYPGEVPVYTITIADNQQTIEVQADDEMALHQALGTLAGGPITFATVDADEIDSQYYDLETVDGTTTVMVPASQLSNLSRNSNTPQLIAQRETDGIINVVETQPETDTTS